MPIEIKSNSAPFRRAEQLKRWEDSETNQVSATIPKDKKSKIKFSDGCVFLAACAASDVEEVERLLKLGTDINTANVDGLTALHQACIDNNLEMVTFLVEHGCDVNRGDNEGWTPLHATASCGFLSIAKYLIEKGGAKVDAVNNDGDLPIDITESTEMEEYLSDVLDEQGIDCDSARSVEQQLMLEDAKSMINSGGDLNDRIHPRTGATPLHVAAAKGYIDVMKLLIQGGADLNAQDNDGWTSLHAAAHWGQKEACAVLADNLVNMDIQNLAGQTCFDVAEPDLVKLLEELKKKQTNMQKNRPDIQAILQRTSNRPPLKRRTSVTRMSGQEKSKSVMKDTKSERVQIENLSLPEEENEEGEREREKTQNELLRQLQAKMDEQRKIAKDDYFQARLPAKVQTPESEPTVPETSAAKEPELQRIPSWKKVLRRLNPENDEVKSDFDVTEVTIKRPKKSPEDSDDKTSPRSNESPVKQDGRPPMPPVRDDESELQRKAHAKRVRETRRSTQGVLLEDIKSAELQYLINTQQEAAKRQAEESQDGSIVDNKSEESVSSEGCELKDNSRKNLKPNLSDISKDTNNLQTHKTDKSSKEGQHEGRKKLGDSSESAEASPSVTLVLRSKSSSSPDDKSPTDDRSSLGTQAAIQRRRRPKRRSTGVVYIDSDDAQEEKENVVFDKDTNSQTETGHSERSRPRYGSSSSIPDTASETSSRSEASSRYGSSSRINIDEEENKDYKKLYEETKKENEKLKEALKKSEEELERTKKQLQKLESNSFTGSLSETEKKERRTLERRISELEEESKQIEKLKEENEQLSNENKALIRVISKLSK